MTIEKITLSNELTPAGMVLVGKVHEIIDVVNSLTGGEKEEPKSNTLREKLAKIMRGYPSSDLNSLETADQILSLVKVHLEKEVGELQTTWVGEEPATVERDDILKIIKNL